MQWYDVVNNSETSHPKHIWSLIFGGSSSKGTGMNPKPVGKRIRPKKGANVHSSQPLQRPTQTPIPSTSPNKGSSVKAETEQSQLH